MKYIYKMTVKAYLLLKIDAREAKMSVEKYITEHSGLLGECIKVEVI